jgi:hypothetical protein
MQVLVLQRQGVLGADTTPRWCLRGPPVAVHTSRADAPRLRKSAQKFKESIASRVLAAR